MQKRYLWLTVLLILAGLRFLPKLVVSPEARTQAYFAVQRNWIRHWPLKQGRYMPRAFVAAVLPVVPVWHQIDPNIKMKLDPNDFVGRTILETEQWEPETWSAMQGHLA